MFESWFSVFGPPAQLVMDQETSLMGHEAGRELERFNVERVPADAQPPALLANSIQALGWWKDTSA